MSIMKKFFSRANLGFLASGVLYAGFLYGRVHYSLPFHYGPLEGDWLVLGYYTSEAALVGSFADWFAVTAVFEVPWIARLLPFVAGHTNILARSREAFVRGCAQMIQEQLLTRLSLFRLKKDICIVDRLTELLGKAEQRAKVQGWLLDYAEGLLRDIDTAALSRKVEAKVKAALGDIEAYKYLSGALVKLTEERKDEEVCDWLLAKIVQLAKAEETRQYIRRSIDRALHERKEKSLWSRFTTWLGEKLDVVNAEDATDAVCTALITAAERLQQDEAWRSWFIEQVRRIFFALYSRREWQQFVELVQSRAVQDVELAEAIRQLLDNTIELLCRKKQAAAGALALATPLSRALEEALSLIEEQLKNSEQLRAQLEKYLQHLLSLLLLWLQSRIGQLIEKIMQAMSDARLSEVVRGKVDSDMQNIRLNGTCMGALIGLVIYICKCAW